MPNFLPPRQDVSPSPPLTPHLTYPGRLNNKIQFNSIWALLEKQEILSWSGNDQVVAMDNPHSPLEET